MSYPRIASFKTADALRRHLHGIGVRLELDDVVEAGPSSPLARSLTSGGMDVGNRFCILPMEGWDGTSDGHPSDLTRRRWRHFGQSGAQGWRHLAGEDVLRVCAIALQQIERDKELPPCGMANGSLGFL